MKQNEQPKQGELKTDSLLAPFRALDLTDAKGYFCGKVLADLGADVIKIEPPGGDPGRNIGPYYGDTPHPEKSLYWFAYNANKRGITLNIEAAAGRDIFKRLVKKAHFVIESFAPGHMERLGLGYPQLSNINPQIILTSITPFGQTGPYRDYEISDIVAMAMGGLMYLTGDPDRPPVRVSFPQAYLHAGSEAAIGTLMAHYYRERTGEGQYVDVSIQASICLTLLNAPIWWDLNKVNLRRVGSFRGGLSLLVAPLRTIWRCRDGYISFSLFGAQLGAATNRALIKWISSELEVPDFWKEMDWSAFDLTKAPQIATQEQYEQLAEIFQAFFLTRTKGELYQGARERNIMLYPVSTTEDITQNPQLRARDFWEQVEHPELGTTITYPGAFIKLTDTPIGIRRRAPIIGEHNDEIYGEELGLSREELVLLKESGVI